MLLFGALLESRLSLRKSGRLLSKGSSSGSINFIWLGAYCFQAVVLPESLALVVIPQNEFKKCDAVPGRSLFRLGRTSRRVRLVERAAYRQASRKDYGSSSRPRRTKEPWAGEKSLRRPVVYPMSAPLLMRARYRSSSLIIRKNESIPS